jgi:arabinose-5-phosphate isomerase
MTPDPATVDPEATAAEALHLMEDRLITALPVVSAGGRLEGVVHLHDLLGRGRVSFKALAREAC